MKQNLYIIDLYDIYGSLLTEKQQKYFEDYYFDNLSLSEISENYNITRNAIHNSLKETFEKLEVYEEKINVYKKNNKLKEIIIKTDNKELKEELEKLI